MTTTHVAIALLLAIYDLPWIVIVLVAWSLGGVFSNSAALAMHESSHQLVIPGAVPSVLIGTVASIPLFFPAYASFRHYHKAHHSYNTIEDQGGHNAHDLPKYDPDLPTEYEALLFSKSWWRRMGFLLMQPFVYSIRPLVQAPRAPTWEDAVNGAGHVLSWIIYGYFGGSKSVIYALCAALLGQGLHIGAIHFIAEHYQLTGRCMHEDKKNARDTYSYYGPVNYMIYNGGYHVEHHDFPKVPCRRLPKVRAMAPEFYESLEYHTSYSKILLRFVFDHEGLWQRVKRLHIKSD